MRIGSNFSQICLSGRLSVCLPVTFELLKLETIFANKYHKSILYLPKDTIDICIKKESKYFSSHQMSVAGVDRRGNKYKQVSSLFSQEGTRVGE